LSVLSGFGRISPARPRLSTLTPFVTHSRSAVKHYKLGIDISLNEHAWSAASEFSQLQLWGFFGEPKRLWRKQHKARLDPNATMTRLVEVVRPDSLEAAAAY
jgi:hypothetical protein